LVFQFSSCFFTVLTLNSDIVLDLSACIHQVPFLPVNRSEARDALKEKPLAVPFEDPYQERPSVQIVFIQIFCMTNRAT
jgi:hypothetical protein